MSGGKGQLRKYVIPYLSPTQHTLTQFSKISSQCCSSLNSAEGWELSCTTKCAQFVFTSKNTVCSVAYNILHNTEAFLLAALTIYLFISKWNRGCFKTVAPCPNGKRRILKTVTVKSLLPSKGRWFKRQTT